MIRFSVNGQEQVNENGFEITFKGKGCNRLRCMVSLPTKPAGKTENGLYKDSVHMKWIGRLHVTVKEMLYDFLVMFDNVYAVLFASLW